MVDVSVSMPIRLSANELDAVRKDPLCYCADRDEMNKRLGWLIYAYDAIVKQRTTPPEADSSSPS